MAMKNTLASYNTAAVKALKSFIVQVPRRGCMYLAMYKKRLVSRINPNLLLMIIL
jgi:hypothetical protein